MEWEEEGGELFEGKMSGGVGGGVGGGKDVEASTPLLGKSTVQAPKFSKKADWATGVPKADWATGVPKAVPTVRSASKPVVSTFELWRKKSGGS